MKKAFLSFLLSLIFLTVGKSNDAESISGDWPKITITIEIGQPITCIIDWAICRVDVGVGMLAATAESFPEGGTSGGGSGGGGGGSWKIYLPRENFARYYPDYLNKLDGKSTVAFNDTYVVPENVQKALGAKQTLVIKGNVAYPLNYENGEFVITFPL